VKNEIKTRFLIISAIFSFEVAGSSAGSTAKKRERLVPAAT
jgi:hypothetical protein